MRHKILIWSKSKETGKGFRIETHEELSQEDIEQYAIEKYMDGYCADESKEYWAELDETIHD